MTKEKLIAARPPFIAAGLLLISYSASRIFDYRIIEKQYSYLGILVIVCGFVLLVSSIRMFKLNNTPIIPGEKPKTLILKGPYKWSRNPIYLGFTIILLGIFVYSGNASFLIAPVLFFAIMNWHFVPFEEKLMGKTFGRRYFNYKKTARRWI